jgi:protein phosphatase
VLELVVADPSLVVLIGAAGSGKSTFAARHFAPAEILSSDAFRALIAGDAADQTVSRAAFARLHRALDARLAAAGLTVVDATNVERSSRRELLVRAARAGVPTSAIVFDLPAETVLARNAARTERVVDPAVVARHLTRLRAAIDGPGPRLADEGFDQVIVLRDPLEVEGFRLRRRP